LEAIGAGGKFLAELLGDGDSGNLFVSHFNSYF
jgi:hypothetical protein